MKAMWNIRGGGCKDIHREVINIRTYDNHISYVLVCICDTLDANLDKLSLFLSTYIYY